MAEPQNQQQQQQGQQQQQQQEPTNETFEEWIAKQPEAIKTSYAAHTGGLKSALEDERKGRKDLEKQLRDLAKKAEKGSDAEATLNAQADKLSALERQSSFFDHAHTAGVRNLKLAYLAAQQAELITDKGECDFTKLKTAYPELFLAAPQGNAGAGTGGQQQTFTMNDAIRHAAGRQ